MLPNKIAVVGATGVVGSSFVQELLQLVPSENLLLLASSRSAGRALDFAGESLMVHDLAEQDFADVDLAFFSAGASVSLEYAPKAMLAGAWVIDNSSAFRSHMPLVVPEINQQSITSKGIIANPNCAVVPLVLTLNALRSFGLQSASVVTFQSVSGSGAKGVRALQQGEYSGVYPVPIKDNVIPFIDEVTDNGFTKEELKLKEEPPRILGLNIPVTATTVRVPVVRGHSMSVSLRSEEPWNLSRVHELLLGHASIQILPDSEFLTPKTHVASCPGVMISRIRIDHSDPNVLLYWLVSDNLLKGAAMNAIQIAKGLGLLRDPVHG